MTTMYLKDVNPYNNYRPVFVLRRIEGHVPVNPKIGDVIGFHDIESLVSNGVHIIIQPRDQSQTSRLELDREYGIDHPWDKFDSWHEDFHRNPESPIVWPCRQPLRCFWRWTRKTGVTIDQNGVKV